MAKIETQYVLVGRDQTKRAFSSFRRNANQARRAVRGLSVAFGAISVGQVVRNIAQAGIALDRIQRGLKLATGDAESAAREFEFIRKTSNQLGLEIEKTATSYTKLAAASRGTVLQGRQTREIFLGISQASRVLGLSADQTQGALTAIEQIISKGKVSAEELRGQLGERLPGAFQIAARSVGKTTQELDKMLRDGELLAEDLLPAMARELQKTFGGQVAEAASDTQSEFARLNNRLFEVAATISDRLNPALAEAARILRGEFLAGFSIDEQIENTKNRIKELRNEIGRPSAVGALGFQEAEQSAELERLKRQLIELLKIRQQDAELAASQDRITTIYEDQRNAVRGIKDSLQATSDELDRYIGNQEKAAEANRKFNESYQLEQRQKRANDLFEEGSNALDAFIDKQEEYAASVAAFSGQFQTAEQRAEALRAKLNLFYNEITPAQRELVELEIDRILNGTEKATNAAQELGLTFSSAFENAIVEGSKLSDVLQGLYKDLLRIFVRKTITEPLGGFLSDAFGSIFGRAIGGPVQANQSYIVGERGPELFVPRGAGKIVPNNQLGSGGATYVFNIDSRSDREQIIAEIVPLLERTRQASVDSVRQLATEGRLL